MLFSCGIGVGIYYFGVSEPMYYYRAGYGNALWKIPMNNDDDRAQQARAYTRPLFSSTYALFVGYTNPLSGST